MTGTGATIVAVVVVVLGTRKSAGGFWIVCG